MAKDTSTLTATQGGVPQSSEVQMAAAERPAAPLPAVASPTVEVSPVEPVTAVSSPDVKSDAPYQVVVKAPSDKGMLAYLVGPGAEIILKGIDLNQATLKEEGGNLRITTKEGGEILLLDYVNSAHDPKTTVVTQDGALPAQKLLAALEMAEQQAAADAKVEPAAGPQGAGDGHGGIEAPTILGTGVGTGEGIFSSVIGPYALPIWGDKIVTEQFPFTPSTEYLPMPGPDNLPPFAHNDRFSTSLGKAIKITPDKLLVNDTDPDNDTLTIISVQDPSRGTVSIDDAGNIIFTPGDLKPGEKAFTGSFSYTISDGHGHTSTADVLIQVDPDPSNENNVIAADDAYLVPVAGDSKVLNVLFNDSDPEGDALVPGSVRILTAPGRGTAEANPDGTITYHSVESTEDYVTTLVYEVRDAKGAADTATVTIEVKANKGPGSNSVDAIDDTGEIVPAGAVKVFNVTANDIDPEGDAFHLTRIVSGPTQGHAVINAKTGEITYYSAASKVGYTAEIVYEIEDARGAKDTATLRVRVEPENNVSAVDDTADLVAGQNVDIKVLANDYDAQGDEITKITITQQPPRGHAEVSADGRSIIFTDDKGATASGVVEFKYAITDARGAVDEAVVRVTITPAINGVDANNDTITVSENAPRAEITDKLLLNDFDAQGDDFSIVAVTPVTPATGTVELVGGKVFFTPAKDYNGPAVFTYTIRDSKGAEDTAQVQINIQEAPGTGLNAGDDSFKTPFDTPLTITADKVLVNDYDPDGYRLEGKDIIAFTETTTQGGTVSKSADGTFIYTPKTGFKGTDTFTYTIKDGQGDTDTATVTIRVEDPLSQDNPVDAVNDTVVLKPGETKYVNVLSNDSAPDGGLSFVKLIDPLPNGVQQDPDNPAVFHYTAPWNETGQVLSFRYEARDADGDTDVATVTFKVEGPANTVDAVDDVVPLTRNGADNAVDKVTFNVMVNDVDPDIHPGHTDSFTTTENYTQPAIGSVVRNADGTFTYTADPAHRDAYETTFTYEIVDNHGAKDTAKVTLKVGADFNNVDAVDDEVTLVRNTADQTVDSKVIDVKFNDRDPQDDPFDVTRIVSAPSIGTAVVNADGTITYTADPAHRDAYDVTFTYEVKDSRGATDIAKVTVHVGAEFNNVDAIDDDVTLVRNTADQTVDSKIIDVKSNDRDPQGDPFSVTRIVDAPSIGTAVLNSNGTITYTADPARRDAYDVTFTYEVKDSRGATDIAKVTVHVGAEFNNVDAVDDEVTLVRNTADQTVDSKIIDVKSNDRDPQGDPFEVTRIVSGPTIGTAVLNTDGTITYTADPARRDAYDVTFTYEVKDSRGATDIAKVTVHVGADYNTVDAVDDEVTLVRNTADKVVDSTIIDVKSNDRDPQGDPFNVTRVVDAPSIGTAVVNSNGTITYTADPARRDAYDVTFTYEVKDSRGATDIAKVTVHVGAEFNNVDAVNDEVTLIRGASGPGDSKVIEVLLNDRDPQADAFSITGYTNPAHGTVVQNANGTFTYTPNNGWNGTDTFTYTITDSKGATDTATVTIHVTNNTVDARDDTATTRYQTPVTIEVLKNDVDDQGDTFRVTGHTNPSHGTVVQNANGTFTYTPASGWSGVDTFTYTITDSKGATDTATVTVTTQAYNNVVAINDQNWLDIPQYVETTWPTYGLVYYVSQDGRTQEARYSPNLAAAYAARGWAAPVYNNVLTTNVKANDFDPQGDTFNISRIIQGPAYGTAQFNSNGEITYTVSDPAQVLALGNAGRETIIYEITDSKGATATARYDIFVRTHQPPPPTGDSDGFDGSGPGGDGGGDGGGGDPLVIDLDNNGFQLTPLAESHAYFNLQADIDPNAVPIHTAWVSAHEGILAMDHNGNGTIDSVNEVYGNSTIDGFTQLSQQVDNNHDNVIDANDAQFNDLRVWIDANQDGISQQGELFTLKEVGIKAIHLDHSSTNLRYQDAHISNYSTVEMEDGSHRQAASVVFTNEGTGNLVGTWANDLLIYSASAKHIDGGLGTNTLSVRESGANIDVGTNVTMHGIEFINMKNGGADKLSINVDDILNMTDQHFIQVNGDKVDEVNISGNYIQGANVEQGGTTYASYTAGNGAQLLVELGVTVHEDPITHG